MVVTNQKSRWRRATWSVFASAAIVAFLLALLWWRVSPASTLWLDEVHSLQLVQLPVERILDESARDFHPPGYALALKTWLKLGRSLGLDPGVTWARLLNVMAWLVLAGGTAFLGHRLLGRAGGLLLLAGVAGSAAASVVVRDLRSYAFAFCSLTLATLIQVAFLEHPRNGSTAARRLLWRLAYVTALATAFWSHLLAAPVGAFLGLAWLMRTAFRREEIGVGRFIAGLVTMAAPWFLFLPWLVRVPGQVAQMRQAAPEWMTPATLENLLHVFDWWIPLGRISPPSPASDLWLTLLGGFGVAIPLVLGLRAFWRDEEPGPAVTLAFIAVPVALASVVLYWGLARLGLVATFHGPRYPLLPAGVLAAGLVGAALAGTRSRTRAALALTPWFLAGLIGQVLAIQQEASPVGLEALRQQVERRAQGTEGRILYVMPSELAPFVREAFTGYELLPVESLLCTPPPTALVLGINPWVELDRPRDLVIAHALRSGVLSPDTERWEWSDPRLTATLYRLQGVDSEHADQLCARGGGPLATAPADALSVASPEDQLAGDGWSYLELSRELDASRWATRSSVRLRFDRPLERGTYRLHLRGVRQPYPEKTARLGLELPRSDLATEVPVPAGPFDLSFRVRMERGGHPVLMLHHPTWSPAELGLSGDDRDLSFMLDSAWFEPAAP